MDPGELRRYAPNERDADGYPLDWERCRTCAPRIGEYGRPHDLRAENLRLLCMRCEAQR